MRMKSYTVCARGGLISGLGLCASWSSQDMYAWNFHQTRELEAQVGHLNSSFWVMPIVHGAFLQRKCDLLGRILNVTLIARRSRHFAGTR